VGPIADTRVSLAAALVVASVTIPDMLMQEVVWEGEGATLRIYLFERPALLDPAHAVKLARN
jgi:hypothetical protein